MDAGIGPITVDPGVQDAAIGRRLMEAVLARAHQQGIASVRLVQAGYPTRSLALYAKLGFAAHEPLAVMQGMAMGMPVSGHAVRSATEADLDAVRDLSHRVHGHARAGEFREALREGTATVVEHGGRITGCATGIGFFGHAVGETTADVKALIATARPSRSPRLGSELRMGVLMRLAVLILATTVSLHPATAQELGTWARASDAPAERSEVSVAEAGGKAYLIGDYNGATELLVYDPARDRWSQGAPFPSPVHHTAAAAQGGKIYVFGGYGNGWQVTDAVWAYDPAADRWERRTRLSTARAAGGAAVIGDRIHLVGGSVSGRSNTPVHEVYDPASDTWTNAAPLPTPRDHLAVAAVAGRLVAVGGRVDGSPSRNLGVNEIYDPATDTWSAAAPLPTPRSGVASAVLGSELYVFGGESGSRVFDEVEAYDLAANRWRRLAGMPTARHGFGAVSFEGRIFTITGSPRPGEGGSRIVEVFKP